MDTAVKKSNKENSKPEAGPKKTESRNFISKQQQLRRPAPLQSKNDPREEKAGDKVQSKAQVKPAKNNDLDSMRRKTLSQAFRTEQTLRHRKLVLESEKPPSSVAPKPLLPGTYKGRVVQSKIDCFRKPPSGQEKNLSEAVMVIRSKSTTALSASSRAGVQRSVQSRTKSGSDAKINVQKTVPQRRIQTIGPAKTAAVSTKPPAVSTKPPTVSTKPPAVSTKKNTISTKPSVISRKPGTMSARPPTVTSFIKKKEPLKPAAVASEQKSQRSISSSISQYRVRVESNEERREKLAAWLASKGKTLKRPTMTQKSASQTCNPRLSTEDEAQPEASEQAEAVPVNQTEQSEVLQTKPAFSSSPNHILNITLDLLDNSDTELPGEPDIRMESLVINLCERLEAMETPSSCKSDTKAGGGAEAEVKVEEEMPEYQILEEEELREEPKATSGVKKNEEDGEEEKETVKAGEEKKLSEGDDEEDEEEEMDSTPADVLDACVVKYSVKTTPFLQSVRKRMEGEMANGTSGSCCKSSIKELKFLTPVRRSSRIHRNSSRLPGMLNEHDPCVSSLAELELLDSHAYVYRKNPALLQHLPDQRPEAQSSEPTCK
ncbi:cytoskeleton-associated protein 2 [Tachysurus vachellii]|uniref:cytoskeleton-associated protein 2 n=1 Tax=Tachysurus vachellii TaxID=175792 RepID=UPI00296AA9A0|nr:cytoskeleton-associated protein 2 [Tachysurus vachellii]XP_060752235.1 cytoskeleton-associated protein 2 [Tachysurus vachellii]